MRLALLLGLALGTALAGCEPTCKNTCQKLLDCEDVETPRVAEDDCEYSCSTQQEIYENTWQDQQKRDAFADAKQCVIDSDCADIANGDCYDADLYIW